MSLEDLYHRLLGSERPIEIYMLTKAVSKERPRIAVNGHVYTPPRTRSFEALVKAVAQTLDRPPYTCPVAVDIKISEPVPKSYKGALREAAELGLINPPVGDLDNKVKAITDGLNKIAYIDDVQIVELNAKRCYGKRHEIVIVIQRVGLSRLEVTGQNNVRSSREGRPRLGEKGNTSVPVQRGQKAHNH